MGIGRLVVCYNAGCAKQAYSGKNPRSCMSYESPDPKKLKKAEKKLAKMKKNSNESGNESSSSKPPSLLKHTTPNAKIRKQLSFELDSNRTYDIKAENTAPAGAKTTCKAKEGKTPAGMSVEEADAILKTMTPDPS